MKKFFALLFILGSFGSMLSCKKDSPASPDEGVVETGIDKGKTYLSDESENKLRDSVWYFYKVLSLWEEYIPPRDINRIDEDGYLRENFTQYFERSENVLDYLMGLTKIDPSGAPIDRYSFIDRQGVISGELEGGVATDFGMYVFYLQTVSSGDNADLYVRMVDVESPAYKAGIRRGDRIARVNGNSDIDYEAQRAQNFAFINNALSSSSMSLNLVKADGSTDIVSINSIEYSFNPVVSEKVIIQDGKKIGYLAFSSFISLFVENTNIPSKMNTIFQDIFQEFETEGIEELVVDLRYNGGGIVNTAEYLANKIVPTSGNGELMSTHKINRYLLADPEIKREFEDVYFSKTNALNLKRVYFLVTSSTASASELLINSLEPYMDVHVVGTYAWDENGSRISENTYGKPVGFFELELLNKSLSLYAASFQTFNADNQGDYFNGLIPDVHVSEFDNFYDFGDERESMLSMALRHINTGTYTSLERSATTSIRNRRIRKGILNMGDRSKVHGMFKFRNKDLKIK
ncbi:S41 family peptidase [Sphingobacterium pedocola]|uniref:Peptidase S41 n=1 Tax=Sphingobacterium pedocola TaxID=2082722 RepID=A0ABR9T423_9SPHI|nr:S41 family peptidase [Sphingobacterium pedocola]MBE8720107.1 peptidase S41 [Sphingobacterium pedocola]